MTGRERTSPEFRAVFSARLSRAMDGQGLSRAKWAEVIGCAPSSLSYFRSGQRVPGLDRAAGIAAILGVSLDWLCGLSEVS